MTACGRTFATAWETYRHETACKVCNPTTAHSITCHISSRCKVTFRTERDRVRHSTSCKYNGDSDDSIRTDSEDM